MSEFNLSAPKQHYVSTVPPVTPGSHVAILVRIVDLGRQWVEWKGEGKFQPKLQMVFELPFNKHVFKEGEEEKPKWLYANFTFIISDNSHLKKFVDGAIGRVLQKNEYDYNIGNLLGKLFLIQVTNTPKVDGNGVWENISSAALITEQSKTMYNVEWDKAVAVNDIWGFGVDEAGTCFKSERFGEFGDHMRQKILNSEQGQAFIASGGIPFAKDPNPPTKAPAQPVQPVQPVEPITKEDKEDPDSFI